MCYYLKIVLIEQTPYLLRKAVINYFTVMADVRINFDEPIKMIWEIMKLLEKLLLVRRWLHKMLPVNDSRDD